MGRASDQGFLPIGVRTYLRLMEWVAATRSSGRRRWVELPREVEAMLEVAEVGRERVWNFGHRFRQAAVRVSRLARETSRRAQRWPQGRESCQAAFG